MDKLFFDYDELKEEISNFNKIRIYGAGGIAQMLSYLLIEDGIKISEHIVTKKSNSEEVVNGVKINELKDVVFWEGAITIVALKGRQRKLIILDLLIENNFKNVVFLSDGLCENIRDKFFEHLLMKTGKYIVLPIDGSEQGHYRIGLKDNNTCIGRIHKEHFSPSRICNFLEHDLLERIEAQYGKYTHLNSIVFQSEEENTKRFIYAATSAGDRERKKIENDMIELVQAGAANTEKVLCELRDDTGENISAKNVNYSECSALYWIWKNVHDVDYLGLCHYRRHFDLPFKGYKPLADNDIDMVLITPTICINSIKEYFVGRFIPFTDWKYMLEGIKRQAPEYYKTAQEYEGAHTYPPCNLAIMRKDVMDEYCRFAFSVCEYLDKKYLELGIYRQERYMGYIMENLLGIFSSHHKSDLRIVFADMKFGD